MFVAQISPSIATLLTLLTQLLSCSEESVLGISLLLTSETALASLLTSPTTLASLLSSPLTTLLTTPLTSLTSLS